MKKNTGLLVVGGLLLYALFKDNNVLAGSGAGSSFMPSMPPSILSKTPDPEEKEETGVDPIVSEKTVKIIEDDKQYVPTYKASTRSSGSGEISATPTTYTKTSSGFTKLAQSYGLM